MSESTIVIVLTDEDGVIGVASSWDVVPKMLEEFYGAEPNLLDRVDQAAAYNVVIWDYMGKPETVHPTAIEHVVDRV